MLCALFLHNELPSIARILASYFIEIKSYTPFGDRYAIINAYEHFFIDFIAEKVGDD